MPTPPTIIETPEAIGALARSVRTRSGESLQAVATRAHLGKRFLSEFERGKPTAEIGKVIAALHAAGLDLAVVPREVPVTEDGGTAVQRLSQRLALEFPYDWSNPDLDDKTLIRKVAAKGRFNDLLRIVGHFGLDRVQGVAEALDEAQAREKALAVLQRIEAGMRRAERRS